MAFLIYESTGDKELLSSTVVPEHAELMELRDVSGSISLACESCYTLPCLRCCNLHGAAWDCFVCVRNSGVLARRKKNKSTVAHPEVPMEIPKRNLSQSVKNYNRDILTSAI